MGLDPHIVISRGQGFGSTVICWFLRGPASHISWTLNKDDIRFNMGSGSKGGLEWEEVHMWKKQNHILAVIHPKINIDDILKTFTYEHLESEYDYWSAGSTGVKHSFAWLWKLFGKEIAKRAEDEKIQCTEAVCMPLQYEPKYTSLKGVDTTIVSVTDCLHTMLDRVHSDQFEILWMSDKCKRWADKQGLAYLYTP